MSFDSSAATAKSAGMTTMLTDIDENGDDDEVVRSNWRRLLVIQDTGTFASVDKIATFIRMRMLSSAL